VRGDRSTNRPGFINHKGKGSLVDQRRNGMNNNKWNKNMLDYNLTLEKYIKTICLMRKATTIW
jgi:hypothetical protein